ncbi:Vesicle transport protein [Kappamyces sp. JEL0680]|nr:Vesicle transport protein [Kappamyces sp. JEL0680]
MSNTEAFRTSFASFQTKTSTPNPSLFSFEFLSKTNARSSAASLERDESQETLLGSFSRGANDAFASISTSVGLTRHPDTECLGLTTFQRYVGFAMMMASSFIFFMISLFTLPMVLLAPGKFAMTYTMGSLLFLSSFTLLNGWKAHAKHLFSWERAPFTGVYLGSMAACLYFAVVSPNYLAILLFTVFQIIALAWYLGSYLPGGTQGLRWMARSTTGLPV